MAGKCVFVFFMIFNSIFGLGGLASLAIGIFGMVKEEVKSKAVPIALLVIGGYITFVFILGACSYKKDGVLIAYFVFILLVIIVNTTMALLVKFLDYFKKIAEKNKESELTVDLTAIIFGITAGVSFLCFLFSTIYFCIRKKYSDNKLYSVVRNLEYASLPKV